MGNRLPTNCSVCYGVTDWGTFRAEAGKDPTCVCLDEDRVFLLEEKAWDEFVAMVDDDRPRFLPGLKKLMDRAVPWLIGDVHEADSASQDADVQAAPCGTDEKLQAVPCSCGKYRFPAFELETLDWSWGPITDDDGVHEADLCQELKHGLILDVEAQQ